MNPLAWTMLDTWIVVAGALSACACALLGNFLVLRRLSLMGDALSHAVLPGLAIAFLVTGSRSGVPMFIGAAVVGVLTALLTEAVHKYGKVEQSAAMGVVFTALFASGIVLMVRAADTVDLDPGCVLYGALEMIPLDPVTLGGAAVPRAVITLSAVLLVNLGFVLLCYKELKLSSFDPALATTLGIHAGVMNYLLMILVAVTTVAAFESVGSILVIAMLIVPGATAHLLTDRLAPMLALSVLVAALAAGLGHVAALTVPGLFGHQDTVTSGMMAVVAGVLFTLAVFLAPRHGLLARVARRWRLQGRILAEDALGLVWRMEESKNPATAPRVMAAMDAAPLGASAFERLASRWILTVLRWTGYLHRGAAGELALTAKGRGAAGDVIRSHRLWQRYLVQTGQAEVHLHEQAHLLEHATTPQLRDALREALEDAPQ